MADSPLKPEELEGYRVRLKNVFISGVIAGEDKLSRQQYLTWINNNFTHYKIDKVEQLCNGEAYIDMFNKLFPRTIPQGTIIRGLKQTEDKNLHNWKVLQQAFRKVGVDKLIDVTDIIKGKIMPNFDFLQWWKKFYDANIDAAKAEQRRKERLAK